MPTLSTLVGEKHHFHVKQGDTISVVPETLAAESQTTEIEAQLTHDGQDTFFLIYLGLDDRYSLKAGAITEPQQLFSSQPAATTPSKSDGIDSLCVLLISCKSKQHEILVKDGDMFCVVAAPGHSFRIKYENDGSTSEDIQNLTLFPENDITLNPANGRSYLVTASPVEHGSQAKATLIRVRAKP